MPERRWNHIIHANDASKARASLLNHWDLNNKNPEKWICDNETVDILQAKYRYSASIQRSPFAWAYKTLSRLRSMWRCGKRENHYRKQCFEYQVALYSFDESISRYLTQVIQIRNQEFCWSWAYWMLLSFEFRDSYISKSRGIFATR